MMKEKRNSRIRLFALLVLVFTLGFGFSVDTSKQSSAVSSQVVQADENNGILTFNGLNIQYKCTIKTHKIF